MTTLTTTQTTISYTSAIDDQQLIESWLRLKKDSTARTYSIAVKQFLTAVNIPLTQLTVDDLAIWVEGLKSKYKPNTVKSKLSSIKSLLTYGQKTGYLLYNVGSAVSADNAKDNLASKLLTKEERNALIDQAQGRDRVLLRFMIASGVRVSELVNLTWDDLSSNGTGGQATIFGKGSKTRTVLIPSRLWLDLMACDRRSEYVFTSKRGGKLSRKTINYLIDKYAQKAGITKKVSPHSLRHTHSVEAIEGGCDLHLLKESLGHSDLSTTSRYLHARPNEGSSQFIDV